MSLKELNVWFDGVREPKRFLIFFIAMLGWLVPLTLSDWIRPHNEIIGVALGIVGGCWFFVIGIIALERAFGVSARRYFDSNKDNK